MNVSYLPEFRNIDRNIQQEYTTGIFFERYNRKSLGEQLCPEIWSTSLMRAFYISSQKRRPDLSGSFSFPVPAAFLSAYCSVTCPISKTTQRRYCFHQLADFRMLQKRDLQFSLFVFIQSLFYRFSLAFLLHKFRFYRDENRASHIYLFLFASDIALGSRTYFQVNF